MSTDLHAKLVSWLEEQAVTMRRVQHAPTRTSLESAAARGEPLEVGAKALLVKVDDAFVLVVLSAALQLDAKRLRTELGAKRSRFASPEELLELTGLVPGSVPPFGAPILPYALYADDEVGRRTDRVAFNAGSLTDSIVMPVSDYLRVAGARVVACAANE